MNYKKYYEPSDGFSSMAFTVSHISFILFSHAVGRRSVFPLLGLALITAIACDEVEVRYKIIYFSLYTFHVG